MHIAAQYESIRCLEWLLGRDADGQNALAKDVVSETNGSLGKYELTHQRSARHSLLYVALTLCFSRRRTRLLPWQPSPNIIAPCASSWIMPSLRTSWSTLSSKTKCDNRIWETCFAVRIRCRTLDDIEQGMIEWPDHNRHAWTPSQDGLSPLFLLVAEPAGGHSAIDDEFEETFRALVNAAPQQLLRERHPVRDNSNGGEGGLLCQCSSLSCTVRSSTPRASCLYALSVDACRMQVHGGTILHAMAGCINWECDTPKRAAKLIRWLATAKKISVNTPDKARHRCCTYHTHLFRR